MRIIILLLTFCTLSSALAQEDGILSLDDYLNQVKNQNLTYSAASQNAEAFELLKKKAKLVTAITLFGSTQTGFAQQNQALQIVRYNQTYTQNTQIGLSQINSIGLNTKFSYSLNHITYKGLNTSNYPNPSLASSNSQVIPKIEISLPLWQNRFGSATRATEDSVFFSNEAQKLSAKSISIQSLVAAQKSYWLMIYARNAIEIQKNALKSAEQILAYVTRRERMNLGDKADVLQAKALFETRRLSLQQAENDFRIAARNFNRQRYLDSDEVVDKLDNFDFTKLQTFVIPKIKADDRYDVKASEANMKAAVAAAKIDEENNKPSLNLYGAYSVNQIQPNSSLAIQNSFMELGKVGVVGINFSAPINLFNTADIRKGARQSAVAAKTNYHQTLFSQEVDWQTLVQNLEIYKENLKLARTIEAAQKSKLENERFRLKQGRTNTYQVLLFEQDYLNSQLVTIQIANQMLAAITDQQLYNGVIQ
jgi:outer membrane protein TolC